MWLKHIEPKAVLLIAATLIVLIPFVLWWLLRLRRIIPLAVIQIFTGILLGPTILGHFAPELHAVLFSGKQLEGIRALAAISICLFAFLAGTETDREVIRSAGRAVMSIGIGGLSLTWLAGVVIGYQLALKYPVAMGTDGGILLFAVAFGLCNAVPALPVLAAVLGELGLNRRRIGAVALAAAAVGDIVLWSAMAIILPLAKSGDLTSSLALAIAGGVGAVGLLILVINPLLGQALRTNAPERVLMILVGIAIFGTAAVTEASGLHMVLGAYAAGVLLPDKIRHMAADKLDMPTSMLLLPFFFLSAGLDAHISGSDTTVWAIFLAGMLVCTIVKVLATILAARLGGENFAFGTMAGILLQTKGLMELVIVTVFRDIGLVSGQTYSALVLVALASTALTMPLTKIFLPHLGEAMDRSGVRPKPAAQPPGTGM
jgi:Kef-type K+ transport system membrane component KefB